MGGPGRDASAPLHPEPLPLMGTVRGQPYCSPPPWSWPPWGTSWVGRGRTGARTATSLHQQPQGGVGWVRRGPGGHGGGRNLPTGPNPPLLRLTALISLSPPTPSQSPASYLAVPSFSDDPAKPPACLSVLGSLITNNLYFLPPSVGLSVPDATHITHLTLTQPPQVGTIIIIPVLQRED